MSSIPLYLTRDHDCSYLSGNIARSVFVHPSFPLTTSIYSELIEHGFRRSGDQVYRPQCQFCSACIPLRIPVSKFMPSRIQKRTLAKNKYTRTLVKPAVFEQKHFDLYRLYQQSRHPDGSMANCTPEDYMNFLGSNWCNTLFIELLIDEKLVAVTIADQLENSLSAVYTFFDPEFSRLSPGIFSVLWQIEYARKMQFKWLYLGFWIKDCQKMSYKDQYRPVQAFIDNQWKEYLKNESITWPKLVQRSRDHL